MLLQHLAPGFFYEEMADGSVGLGSSDTAFPIAWLGSETFLACYGIPHVIHLCVDFVCSRHWYNFETWVWIHKGCKMCIQSFDRPEVSLCGWQDVRLQVQTNCLKTWPCWILRTLSFLHARWEVSSAMQICVYGVSFVVMSMKRCWFNLQLKSAVLNGLGGFCAQIMLPQ